MLLCLALYFLLYLRDDVLDMVEDHITHHVVRVPAAGGFGRGAYFQQVWKCRCMCVEANYSSHQCRIDNVSSCLNKQNVKRVPAHERWIWTWTCWHGDFRQQSFLLAALFFGRKFDRPTQMYSKSHGSPPLPLFHPWYPSVPASPSGFISFSHKPIYLPLSRFRHGTPRRWVFPKGRCSRACCATTSSATSRSAF